MSDDYLQSDELDIEQDRINEEADTNRSDNSTLENWHAGYVPPYRAAYFRA